MGNIVQTVNNSIVVFVPGEEKGEFFAHPVTLGREGPSRIEVTGGLNAGDRVVVDGTFVLKTEMMRDALGQGCADGH